MQQTLYKINDKEKIKKNRLLFLKIRNILVKGFCFELYSNIIIRILKYKDETMFHYLRLNFLLFNILLRKMYVCQRSANFETKF